MSLTIYPMQDDYSAKLTRAWDGATGTLYVTAAPSFTMPANSYCIMTVDPGTSKAQSFLMDSFSVANKTLNCYSIAVDKGPGLAYTQQTHSVGAKVIISDNYAFWAAIKTLLDGKMGLADANIVSGSIGFSGTSTAGFTVKSLTTAQRDAIASPANGNIIYNSTTGELNVYQGGAWSVLSSGSTQPNASTTVAGKVEAPTQTEVEQLATTGGTGALVFVTPTTINPSSITGAAVAVGDKISFSDVNDNNYLKSTTVQGILDLGLQLASSSEAEAGVVTTKAVTPAQVSAYYGFITNGTPTVVSLTIADGVTGTQVSSSQQLTKNSFATLSLGTGASGGTSKLQYSTDNASWSDLYTASSYPTSFIAKYGYYRVSVTKNVSGGGTAISATFTTTT